MLLHGLFRASRFGKWGWRYYHPQLTSENLAAVRGWCSQGPWVIERETVRSVSHVASQVFVCSLVPVLCLEHIPAEFPCLGHHCLLKSASPLEACPSLENPFLRFPITGNSLPSRSYWPTYLRILPVNYGPQKIKTISAWEARKHTAVTSLRNLVTWCCKQFFKKKVMIVWVIKSI